MIAVTKTLNIFGLTIFFFTLFKILDIKKQYKNQQRERITAEILTAGRIKFCFEIPKSRDKVSIVLAF